MGEKHDERAASPLGLPERQRPGEHREGREAARPHIDDRTVRGVHEHVSHSIEPSADARREAQERVR